MADGSIRGIPSALEGEVLSQHLAGKTTREIAAWLKAEHKVDVSYRTVARFLKETRKDNAAGHKAALNAAAAGGALDDLARLDVHARMLHEQALMHAAAGDLKAFRMTVEAHRKIAHTRLHFAGADSPDAALTDLADAAQRVTSRLARLASADAARSGDGAAGADGAGAGRP